MQLIQNRLVITGCGMFTLDYSLIHSIVAAATSYLIILIQFELADLNERIQ